MKTILISSLLLSAFLVRVATSEVIVNKPEKGITCIHASNLIGSGRTPAGCYSGDIHGDNKLDQIATNKYQPNAIVISLN
jgi:hypothetical protein